MGWEAALRAQLTHAQPPEEPHAGERAGKAGVTTAVFDRGGSRYHGRVKALAEGAREGGLSF